MSDEEREKLIDDNVLVGGYHNTSRHLMKHFGCIISILRRYVNIYSVLDSGKRKLNPFCYVGIKLTVFWIWEKVNRNYLNSSRISQLLRPHCVADKHTYSEYQYTYIVDFGSEAHKYSDFLFK